MCICVYLLTAGEPARHEDVVRTSAVCTNVHVTDWLEGAEQQGRSADSALARQNCLSCLLTNPQHCHNWGCKTNRALT